MNGQLDSFGIFDCTYFHYLGIDWRDGPKINTTGWDIVDDFMKRGINITTTPRRWSEWLCLQDSDHDGKTNGDELGDPCCEWNYGDIPYTSKYLSHPGDSSSVITRPSCYLNGLPPDPVIETYESGKNQVLLKLKLKLDYCICHYEFYINNQYDINIIIIIIFFIYLFI